jgi:putative DNA primase/helicase
VTEQNVEAAPAEKIGEPNRTPEGKGVSSNESIPQTEAPQATRPRGLPPIVITDKQLREITEDALHAIHAANDPPRLFERGGVLTQLHVKDSVPTLEALSREALRGHLARVADWKRKVGKVSVACYPPMPVVADVQALSSWRDIPPLKEVIEAPIFAADGSLVTDIGYHAGSKLYFAGETGLVIPSVSMSPSNADIKEAVGRLDELFADFPFKDDSSRAHAFALTLLPFARELVDGLTPLHLIDAPAAGTGKGLLAEVVSIPAMGRGPDVMTEGRDEDEWRKRITAALVKGARFLLIDNLRRRLDSGQLAGALTATPAWTDRLLGHSLTVTIPVRCVWVATGNNVSMSNEMSRRTVWIRLDAKKEAPWTRSASSFRHPLPGWARENRGQLIHACLTIIQGWLAAGRPKADKSLGRFESWAEVIGGILAFAGVKGFLSNANELYSRTDDETRPWREFVQCWWEAHGNKVVGAEQLYDLATAQNLLTQVLGDNGDRSQRTRLGIALGKMRDRVFGDFRISACTEDNHSRQRYRLERLTQPTSTNVPPTSVEKVDAQNANNGETFGHSADVGRPSDVLGADQTPEPNRPIEGAESGLGSGKTSAEVGDAIQPTENEALFEALFRPTLRRPCRR